MATTVHIPNEIFVEIFSRLRCQELARVSLISRRLHSVSQPLLYLEPELYDQEGYTPSLQAFLRTLLTPGSEPLTTHVRRLTISWKDRQIEPFDHEYPSFRAAASRFGLRYWPLSADTQVMILLHLLPRLECLLLLPPQNTIWFRNFVQLYGQLQPTMTIPIGLHTLREFRCDFDSCVRPKTLVALLMLPNLRTIAIPVCGDIEVQFRGSSGIPYGTSAVTKLEFPFARMPNTALMRILQIPHALTHFSYRAKGISGANISLINFEMALQPLKASLQTLVLDFSRLIPSRTRGTNEGGPTAGFLDWPALRSVSCSLIPLLGKGLAQDSPRRLADVLPTGIRTLRILADKYWSATEAAQELLVLLEQKVSFVPGLESVGLWEHGELVEERVRELCQTAGIQIFEGIEHYPCFFSGADNGIMG